MTSGTNSSCPNAGHEPQGLALLSSWFVSGLLIGSAATLFVNAAAGLLTNVLMTPWWRQSSAMRFIVTCYPLEPPSQ